MKQSEKLDLILRELYKYKNDGIYHSINNILKELNVPIDSIHEILSLGQRLSDDGFIKESSTTGDCLAELTSRGIDYSEGNSYSYEGQSIITNNYSISIVNSPNSNVVNQSSNVTITANVGEANNAIEEIRKAITTDGKIEKSKANEILECLNEIQESIKNNQKPKFSVKSLLDITGGISSIASWVTTLGQFAGIIPLPS